MGFGQSVLEFRKKKVGFGRSVYQNLVKKIMGFEHSVYQNLVKKKDGFWTKCVLKFDKKKMVLDEVCIRIW